MFKYTVDHVLAIFTFMVHLLEKRAAQLEQEVEAKNKAIQSLIAEREAHVAEQFRANAAVKKIKDLLML